MAEAFALREDHQGTITAPGDDGQDVTRDKFVGATFSLPDGYLFDVGQALSDHDGVIVTEDPALILALAEQPALKRTTAPEGATLVTSYEAKPLAALQELPAARGITGIGSMRRDEVLARLALANSGQDPNGELEQPAPRESARKTPNAPGAKPVAPAESAAEPESTTGPKGG